MSKSKIKGQSNKPAPAGTTAANQAMEAAQAATMGSGITPGLVTQNREEVAQSEKLIELGKQIIQAIGAVSEKYHALIVYVRTNKVAPKLVTYEMTKLGFARSRIAEVKRVAFASNETYSAYESKLIGFSKALELARTSDGGKEAELTEAGRLLTAGGSLSDSDAEEAISDAESSAKQSGKGKSKKKSVTARLNSMFRDLALFASINAKDRVAAGKCEYWLESKQVPGGWVHAKVSFSTKGGSAED